MTPLGFRDRHLPQRADELDALAALIAAEGVTRYCEIGLQRGLTLHWLGCRMKPGSLLVGVDLPGAEWGLKDGSGPGWLAAVAADLRAAHGQRVEIILGDSHAAATIAAVAALGPYDLVFIDADHRPAAVRADWRDYAPLARMVAFHDIDTSAEAGITPRKLAKYGVAALWAEIRLRHRSVEFVGAERGMGIGVAWTGR